MIINNDINAVPEHAPEYMKKRIKKLYEEAYKIYPVSRIGSFALIMSCLELLCLENGCIGVDAKIKVHYLINKIRLSVDLDDIDEFIEPLANIFRSAAIHQYNEDIISMHLAKVFNFLHLVNDNVLVYINEFQGLTKSNYCIVCEENNKLIVNPHRIHGSIYHNGYISQECVTCGSYKYFENRYIDYKNKLEPGKKIKVEIIKSILKAKSEPCDLRFKVVIA